MDKFFESLPAIIEAAAQSDLGIMALLIAAISVLSFFFFSKASEATRILIFLFLFSGVVGFGLAIFREAPEAIEQSNINADLVTQPVQEVEPESESEVKLEQTPKPVKPAPPPPPPKKEGWLAYRYDIFSCDSNPQEAQNLASQISRNLESAGIADVRLKWYDARYRKLSKGQGFSGEIYTSASIRYYGLREERAAGQAQAFLYSKTGVNFELEEVDPSSPTPGILSIFVCPGFSDIPYPTRSDVNS